MQSQDDSKPERRYLPDPQVCRRYGVCAMTLWRWDHDPEMNFPKPMRVGRRKYRDEEELVAWERWCVASDAAAPRKDSLRSAEQPNMKTRPHEHQETVDDPG